ncbi:bifunctional demethylmenaquinone methyltransferase/2-methoxy-6-polyprenyl-1,4-benzoquinol methylase UbiE [Caminibacter sp.]
MSRQEEIVEMFDSISKKYDLVNRILTFGVDIRWRKKAIKKAFELIPQKAKILDVACGTGDMISLWKDMAKKYNKNLTICGLDPSRGMLEVAREKLPDVKFYQAYATDIPCESESIDAISVSFGIRNVLEIEKAIEEFNRVLKQNGIVVVLEFTKSKKPHTFRKCVDFYSNKFLPKIGGLISKNKKAYEYLPNSIQNFYTPEELSSLFTKKGFEIIHLENFNFDQVTLLIAKKII